jgi:hypothetical protein
VRETGALGPVYGGRWSLLEGRYLEPWEIRAQELRAGDDPELVEQARLKVHIEELTAKQQSFAEDFVTPFIMANGSRRAGKSRGSAGKSLLHVARFPGMGGEIIAPTFPKCRIMWRYARQVIPASWIERELRAEMILQLWNGAEIKFLSAYNPDSLIGEGVAWIAFDEFQNVSESAFSLALPALSDAGSALQCWGTGTPRMGEYKTRYERFLQMQRDGRARVMRFTYRDNCYIDHGAGSIFDLARAVIDPRRRQQELDALFVSEEGLVYYLFSREKNGKSWTEEGREKWAPDVTERWCRSELGVDTPWLVGVDYGVGKQFCVIYKIAEIAGRPCPWAVGEVVLRKNATVQTLADELIERGFYPAAVCDDASGPHSKGGRSAATRLENARDANDREAFHVFHNRTNPPVQDRVDAVNALLGSSPSNARLFVDLEECPQLVKSFENQELENGKPRRSRPGEESLHDVPDAAGYPIVFCFPADFDYEGGEVRKAA